ncbi:MAG: CpsD/CapB family tyrosine-protein kinase, partial [Acidobacteria bacterium]|nr:CpsD/CapB family tyrosine-protein kinase [Acidobacteriota bacterium]
PLPVQNGQRLAMASGHSLSHLSWFPHELHVLSELKTPRTLAELAAATGLDNGRLGKILSVLHSLKLIALVRNGDPPPESPVPPDRYPFERLTPEANGAGVSERLEVLRDESTFISEQFKTLKVRIGEGSQGNPPKTIIVTSPGAQDGKSLVCANLALSFSRDMGRRVLLVDCDLRNPSLHRYLGISLEPGLLGYLQTEGLHPGCFMRRLGDLYILTAGGVAANPVETLTNDRTRSLLVYLKAEFDTILLDAPPLAPISDAQILSGLSDGVIVVLRSGRTLYRSVREAFRNLDRSKLLGLVLNDVKPMLFNTQYPYKYYHYKYRDHYPYAGKRRLPPTSRPKPYFDE